MRLEIGIRTCMMYSGIIGYMRLTYLLDYLGLNYEGYVSRVGIAILMDYMD